MNRVLDGLSLKAIAFEMANSPHTAATYLARARQKLRLPSRWKLAAMFSGPLPHFRQLIPRKVSKTFGPVQCELGDYVLAGLSNAEIAERMRIGSKTAARRVERLLKRLGLGSRGDLIAMGRQFGSARRSTQPRA